MKKTSLSSADRANALNRINVLLLDGDSRMLEIEKSVLRDLGFSQIFMAKDGEEGLRIMAANPIHLVITDWNMHPMDGMEFIKTVRSRTDSPDCFVPIILLTGHAESNDVNTARDSGITEYVVKPFTVKRLIERIIVVINNPRSFILTPNFKGHDRRRRSDDISGKPEKRKRKP